MTVTTWTTEGSVSKLLSWRLDERPEHGFLYVEDDGPWSYRHIAAAAATVRDELAGRGVTPGDRVIVQLGNDERFLAALAGVWALGAAAIAVHPATPVESVLEVSASMATRPIIADPESALITEAPERSVSFARFAARDEPDTGTRASRFTAPDEVTDDEPALVLLTSGSTGRPKGVVLTHGNIWSNLAATVSAFRGDTRPTALPTRPTPPNLISNPLSHTAGVVRLLFALYVGRSVVLLRKFDGRVAKRMLDRHGIDNLTINPAMLRMLLDQLEPGEDLGGVRYVSSGTAPLTPALREEFEDRFGVPILQAYGQTEAFGGIAIESARDVLKGNRRPGSVGKPLPGVELRIVDGTGTDVEPGAEGEIWVRSRSATSGYLGDDSVASPVDEQGWLHTGDLARRDGDGYLYITGRLKNIIICGGFNVVPEELEAALASDPAVTEAVVVGVPDDRLGEVPLAVVQVANTEAASGDAIAARVAPRLASFKRPRAVFPVDALPRVPNGKVDRPALRELAQVLWKQRANAG